MPVQHSVMGRSIPFQTLPRRFIILFGGIGLFCIGIFLLGPPSSVTVASAAGIKDSIRHPKLPSVPPKFNPFSPSAHKPPEQANSTGRGDSKWLSDWKWHNPFSSAITLDENRAVLPPLNKRYPVYTFYDDSIKKEEAVKKAENELLLIWRRSWWAQGFKPIVLSRAEAMRNPLYEPIQKMGLKADLEADLAKWLAWGTMGTGILANWLAVPMAPYQDELLSHLRRGEYPMGIARFAPLRNGLFFGEGAAVAAALKKVTGKKPEELKDASSILDILEDGSDFTVEAKADSIAYYNRKTVANSYKVVSDKIGAKNDAEGLRMLGLLINAHLHITWQNTFSDGVAVLKPLPQHTTALVEPAVEIARNLTQCPTSPIPISCPPNRPKCAPCLTSQPKEIQMLAHYRNITTIYTVGTVPHPYTFTSLHYRKEALTTRFLRREAERDMWLATSTKELLGTGVAATSRVVRFKESVAGIHGASHSLWLTAERETHTDLDWIFGFRLPREADDKGTSETPVPGPERRPPPPKSKVPPPTETELVEEKALLSKARQAIRSEAREMVKVREMVEAWNLADTEAWKFARAFSARRRVEREVWEQEERKYAGAEARYAD